MDSSILLKYLFGNRLDMSLSHQHRLNSLGQLIWHSQINLATVRTETDNTLSSFIAMANKKFLYVQ